MPEDDPSPEDTAGADAFEDAGDASTGAGRGSALPPKVESWRRRSATGAIITGFALGLQEALDPHKSEPSIVVQTSGDPPRDLPVEADFEHGRPRQSVVNIRPWLLGEVAGSNDEPGTGEPGAGPDGDQG